MKMEKGICSLLSQPDKCVYTSCYCEENVWKLCDMVKETCGQGELNRCYAVFISNANKKIPLWHQKASTNEQRMVVWDYHVILVYASSESRLVYDLDTELGFPCQFKEYVAASLGDESLLNKQFWRKFRVVGAESFLSKFASDRSHMLRPDGTWMSPAPTYIPIQTAKCTNNLQNYINMDGSDDFGTVFNLDEFRKRFTKELI